MFPKTRFKSDSKDLTLSEVSSYGNKEVELEDGTGFSGDSSVAIYGVRCAFLLPMFKKNHARFVLNVCVRVFKFCLE